ncbi:MAG TPA: hypothetical protein ENG40_01625 [Thermoprotei archaeon]|nr:hypothetical protein [Thermoprotei archaeon]
MSLLRENRGKNIIGEVRLKGYLLKRKKIGPRRMYRKGYFSIISDGKFLRDIGKIVKNSVIIDRAFRFKNYMKIIGKTGTPGLEGMNKEGGRWVSVTLKPSRKRKEMILRLPFDVDASVELKVAGSFDIEKIEKIRWNDDKDFIFFKK